jgi:hypothetical protein
MLEAVEAAPLIPAPARARAARAAKPKPPKGERVRKQRSHTIAPLEDQPVSARLRSAKLNSFIDAKKQGDKSALETVRRSPRTRKTGCLPAGDFPNENGKHKDEPKEVCVNSELKATQLPAPSNEPKERASVSFRDHSLESDAILSSDDSSEWMFEDFADFPDEYDDVSPVVDEDAHFRHDDLTTNWIPVSFTDIDYPDDCDDVSQVVDEDACFPSSWITEWYTDFPDDYDDSSKVVDEDAKFRHDDSSSWIPECFTDIPDDDDDISQIGDEDAYFRHDDSSSWTPECFTDCPDDYDDVPQLVDDYQTPAPSNEPKKRKGVTFRDQSLVSEAFFYRHDRSCVIDQGTSWKHPTSFLCLLKHIPEFTESLLGIAPLC